MPNLDHDYFLTHGPIQKISGFIVLGNSGTKMSPLAIDQDHHNGKWRLFQSSIPTVFSSKERAIAEVEEALSQMSENLARTARFEIRNCTLVIDGLA